MIHVEKGATLFLKCRKEKKSVVNPGHDINAAAFISSVILSSE
jgi:hypothetical protein